MKVINVFINVFSIMVFLTLGSFLLIISIHIVPLDDALRSVAEVYTEPLRSLQAGLMGFLFIFVGLSFAKFIVKNTRGDDALILHGENGTITISVVAIEDVVKKILRKFDSVKEFKVKTTVRSKSLSVAVKLTIWSGVLIPEVVGEVQSEIRERLEKMLGTTEYMDVSVGVQKVVASEKPKREVA